MGRKGSSLKCSECGNPNLKYRSIACHISQCKGQLCVVPRGEWICEGGQRGFSTKISLGQHKGLMHSLVRNLEWIVASSSKESSVRGAHKKVWTEEEEALLVERFAGSRNIQVHFSHLLTVTAVSNTVYTICLYCHGILVFLLFYRTAHSICYSNPFKALCEDSEGTQG